MLFKKPGMPDNGEVADLCRQLSDNEAEQILSLPDVQELIERHRAKTTR